jgi:hypothetical protein
MCEKASHFLEKRLDVAKTLFRVLCFSSAPCHSDAVFMLFYQKLPLGANGYQ